MAHRPSDPFVSAYLEPPKESLVCAPLLPAIAAQAAEADRTRSVSSDVIAEIKASDLMQMSASRELGGGEATVAAIADELEAVAGCCSSTSWCLWNHLCVFHFYCGTLGPSGKNLLAGITAAREWVSLPAGAGSQVIGRRDGDDWVISGSASFASGARYGEWAGVVFTDDGGTGAKGSAPELLFGVVRTDQPGVRVEATWNGSALRASATDHIHYEDARIPPEAQGRWLDEYRKTYRRSDYAVFSERYREDWVGLSDLWLGAQAVGCAHAALDDVASSVRNRIAIFGVKMSERPMVQVNLGQAAAKIASARSVVQTGCRETDERIHAGVAPTEADYLRQLSLSMAALELCDDAMKLLLRVLGGNGLREGNDFERRYRDMQAMPLHINAHRDRVSEQLGRHVLGLDTDNPF